MEMREGDEQTGHEHGTLAPPSSPVVMSGRQSALRIFFFSDWRVQELNVIDRAMDEAGGSDLILYGGDDVARFCEAYLLPPAIGVKVQNVLARVNARRLSRKRGLADIGSLLGQQRRPLSNAVPLPLSFAQVFDLFRPTVHANYFARLALRAPWGVGGVLGNDCHPLDRAILEAEGVRDLHAAPYRVGDWGILGCEGSVHIPGERPIGTLLWSEEEMAAHLERSWARLGVPSERLIVVSHTPPAGCLDLAIRFGVRHIGSRALADFIVAHQPALVLCGHVHSQGGRSAHLGRTLVINAASDDGQPYRGARSALVQIAPESEPEVTWITPYRRSIYALRGVGSRTGRVLEAAGLGTLSAVETASDTALVAAGLRPAHIREIRIALAATRRSQVIWHADAPLRLPERLLFYDVETGLAPPQEAWMIGVLDETNPDATWQASEPDEKPRKRRAMLASFLARVESAACPVCSWSMNHFDRYAVRRALRRWAPELLPRWESIPEMHLLIELRRCMILPLGMSWSLDTLARWGGVALSDTRSLSGMEIGMAYDAYRRERRPLPLEDILCKNRGDLHALAHIAQAVRTRSLPILEWTQ